jgi:tetratricopeptide (TPR) repeat protein
MNSVEKSLSPESETIVPVRPALRTSAPPPAGAGRGAGAIGWWVALVGAAAVALAFVFFVLPQWVAPPEAPAAAVGAAPVSPDPPPVPELSPAERAALAAEAERLLAQLLTQTARLDEQGASGWGADGWTRYVERSRAGDDAYLAKSFPAAVQSYTDALAAGEALIAQSHEIVERALTAARAAFAAGNAEHAIGQYDVVLGIEPEHEAAKRERERAARLPEVLALVAEGDSLRDGGKLEDAAAAYRRALEVDAGWQLARDALTAVTTRIANDRFDGLMSAGFAALAREDYEAAAEQFSAALAMRPSATAAREGLVQAEQGAKLGDIALAEARALAFERRERWELAVAQYQAALAADPTLVFAKTGLARATARADLDAKIANLIEKPTLLFQDAIAADARKLLEQAAAVDEPDAPRIAAQRAELERLLNLASTPLPVQLRSDQLTEVTVYRVGPLGTFAVKDIELRPGTYTAVGSRNGYRDVRSTFTVLPGRSLPPIEVICSEPI